MRQFRLKQGDFSKANAHEYGKTYVLKNIDLDGDIWLIENDDFQYCYCYLPDQVEEVFENQFEPEGLLDRMHKDTDLGYYAGFAMQGILSNSNSSFRVGSPELISCSISIAKELIKQLDQEIK